MDPRDEPLMDPDTDSKFLDISSTNARLMREMNAFLAAMSHSPGEETNCSCETKATDNLSSSDGPLSARLKVPFISATSSENGGSAIIESGDGDETQNKVRSGNKNLISIDENGASNPSGEYESYNNSNYCDSLQSSGHSDEDSLVAMAKRMDDASIISDPSLICGPSEKNLSLPLPPQKKLTASIKKLGQRINNNRAKPAPPNQAPPRPPPRNPQQLNQQQMPASSSLNPSESDKRNQCTLSSGSPSSSKEIVEITTDNLANLQSSGTLTPPSLGEYFTSFDSANNFGDSDQALLPEIRAKKVSENKDRKHEPSFKHDSSKHTHTLTRGENKALRRGSGKKSRKPYPSNMPHSPSSAEENTVGRKVNTKSKSDSRSRRGKKGRKERQSKRNSDSDDEPMQGKGFNTRINDKPSSIDNKPKGIAEQMKGKEFDTRIHSKPSIGNKPERIAKQLPKQPQVHSNKRSHKPSQIADTEIQMDQCENSDNDDSSSYDSDDQTQIFYESTDDDGFDSEEDSEEELVAVGTSVADAVACLNEKSAVTKVKNLFGIRG